MQEPLFDPPEPVEPSEETASAIRGGKRFIDVPGRAQLSYDTWCLKQLVPEDAFVRVLDAILDRLDFTAFEAAHPGGGRPAHPPRLICKLLIYGYSQGVRSSRELSRRLERDQHVMWLAHGMKIDHEIFSDLRKDFKDLFKDIFEQTLRLAASLGMVGFGHISIDGTKIAAHARRRAADQKALDRAIARVRKQIAEAIQQAEQTDAAEDEQFGDSRGDELPKELASLQARNDKLEEAMRRLQESGQKHVCVNDPDAPLQKSQDGKRPGYNGQISVDDEEGIITAQDVVPDQNDTAQFMPMAEQTVDNLGRKPDEFVADTGYHSGEALSDADEAKYNAYIAEGDASTEDRYTHSDFDYDPATDSFTCPAQKLLVFKGFKEIRYKRYRRYRAAHTCRLCPQRDKCISPKARYRDLLIGEYGGFILAMREKMATDAGAAAMQTRKETVERVFGMIKEQIGLRQFLLVGLEKVRAEFSLATTAYNLQKIAGRLALNRSVTAQLDAAME